MSGLSDAEMRRLVKHFHSGVLGVECSHSEFTKPCHAEAAAVRPLVEAIVAAREAAARAEGDDLRSRLACVLEASYWDRGYDERIAAIRGMCDLSTDGMTPAELDERPLAAARAEGAAGVLAEVEALVNDPELVKAVERRIRNYGPLDAEPYQYSRFGSIGEAALDPLRAILARHAEGGEG